MNESFFLLLLLLLLLLLIEDITKNITLKKKKMMMTTKIKMNIPKKITQLHQGDFETIRDQRRGRI